MNTENKAPHYRRLYELLRKKIVDGNFKEGDMLPSENELCRAHNLTRPTVRHALDTLLNDGFIKKHKGKGSIVSQMPNGIGLLSIRGTTSVVGKSNLQTKMVRKPFITTWPDNFMFPLGADEFSAGCIYFERLRLVNNIPYFYEKSWLPNINLPRFTSRNMEDRSLFESLRKFYQIEIKNGEQKFKAIPADQTLSILLNIELGQPVLNLDRKHNTNRENYRFYSSLFCNTESYTLYGTF